MPNILTLLSQVKGGGEVQPFEKKSIKYCLGDTPIQNLNQGKKEEVWDHLARFWKDYDYIKALVENMVTNGF